MEGGLLRKAKRKRSFIPHLEDVGVGCERVFSIFKGASDIDPLRRRGGGLWMQGGGKGLVVKHFKGVVPESGCFDSNSWAKLNFPGDMPTVGEGGERPGGGRNLRQVSKINRKKKNGRARCWLGGVNAIGGGGRESAKKGLPC